MRLTKSVEIAAWTKIERTNCTLIHGFDPCKLVHRVTDTAFIKNKVVVNQFPTISEYSKCILVFVNEWVFGYLEAHHQNSLDYVWDYIVFFVVIESMTITDILSVSASTP